MTPGETHNNPGDLRRTHIDWLGLKPPSDKWSTDFCSFDTPLHGIRAMARVILNAFRIDGCRTLAALVNHYAPPAENDTESYIAFVSAQTGIGPEDFIDPTQHNQLASLVTAFIHEEQGSCIYSADTIALAVAMAIAKPGVST